MVLPPAHSGDADLSLAPCLRGCPCNSSPPLFPSGTPFSFPEPAPQHPAHSYPLPAGQGPRLVTDRDVVSGAVEGPHGHAGSAQAALVHVPGHLAPQAGEAEGSANTCGTVRHGLG